MWRIEEFADKHSGAGRGAESLSLPMLTANKAGVVLYTNEAMRRLLGGRPKRLDRMFTSLTFKNGEEVEVRANLRAPATEKSQDLYVSGPLKTERVMIKDENVCLHCGLCAERCPTGAWDMQKYLMEMEQAGPGCRTKRAGARAAGTPAGRG